MERLENERKVIQESLQQSADQVTSQLAEATAQNTELLNKREVIVCRPYSSLRQQLKTQSCSINERYTCRPYSSLSRQLKTQSCSINEMFVSRSYSLLKQQLKTLELINKTRGMLEDLTAH